MWKENSSSTTAPEQPESVGLEIAIMPQMPERCGTPETTDLERLGLLLEGWTIKVHTRTIIKFAKVKDRIYYNSEFSYHSRLMEEEEHYLRTGMKRRCSPKSKIVTVMVAKLKSQILEYQWGHISERSRSRTISNKSRQRETNDAKIDPMKKKNLPSMVNSVKDDSKEITTEINK